MGRDKITLAVITSAALILTTACGGSADPEDSHSSAEGATAHFGVMLPLTGENAENGKQMKDAIQLHVDEYNAGDHKFKINLTVRDDRGEPKTATNIAREFAEDNTILGVLGSFTSTASMAAAPILDSAGIPQVSPTSSHPEFTNMGSCVFRGTPTQDLEATGIAEHTVKALGKTKATIIYRQDDWGNAASKAFQSGFESSGGSIDSSEAVAPDSRDFRTLVTSLKAGSVNTVYLALQYSDAAVLAQQMEASAWKPTIITATSLYTHELITLSDTKAVEGWHVPAFFYAESTEPIVADFVAAFKSKYNKTPDAFGAVSYDSMKVLTAALDKIDEAGTNGRKPVCDAMYTVEVPGATGVMKFDKNGDVQKPITWLAIHDGKFVPSE